MGATFKEIAHKQIEAYKKQWYKEAYFQLQELCKRVLKEAVVNRTGDPYGHEFTGNLLNSIAIALVCSKDVSLVLGIPYKQVLRAQKYAGIKPAEFDATGGKPMQKGRHYVFVFDYEGDQSEYRYDKKGNREGAEAEGGDGYDTSIIAWSSGIQGVRSGNMFEIHLAYTAPYARFVDTARDTVHAIETAEFLATELYDLGVQS